MAILNYAPPTNPYLDIIYQDDDILLLNKPSGLLSVPGKAFEHRDSLQTRVQTVFPTATVVHRLDMATSGLMVMALNKPAHRHISKQFELRETSKTYIAVVYGHTAAESGTVDLPLICDWPNRPKQMVDHERGKKALTHWSVLQRNENSTRVELKPITGRSHQLRVHMLSLGHPIIGDRLYAHPEALEMANRLNLHALTLSFRHPQSEQALNFETPVPF
ncbi:bifunctional tRNA pseudouridine(32) synthase/23S rRNA pseudouridine(746) synthase RluA [Paraglaciecola sp. L3A3]|uniref:bifunctional tRNA pseudouridine(32) synthase/23S rRNA pseudouridine(746) synthase RluA n=1 Tax=Paraglaciecola sp. L3A3 TaxID=2686358 RepID=UPI00131DD3A5|nr:bifunctional tRNA pseudouridine(32) synthase/23S rRNA pseudouridine(746) synthase RluA [Paraglaciecola sp. L3A3]